VRAQTAKTAHRAARNPKKPVTRGPGRPKSPLQPRTVAEGTTESIGDAIEQLRACTKRVKAMLESGEEYDSQLGSHLAWVAHKMAGCLDAMRKQEAAERARWKTQGLDEETALVKVWLDECPQQARAAIREHLAGLAEGGLLS